MNEHARAKFNKPPSNVSENTSSTLRKMQFQLDAIERKLDALINQSNPRKPHTRNFSSNRQDFDEKPFPYKQKHAKRKGEGKFYEGLQSGAHKGPRKSGLSKNKNFKRKK